MKSTEALRSDKALKTQKVEAQESNVLLLLWKIK